ncbi:MAG TPA: MFS transporter, partial [Clostridiales bacterium]|nr:MFS transporter [Clostridiales bacterium]
MATLLLVVIYLSFISLGVPDSLLGTAWPVLYRELGVPLASQSAVSILCSLATMTSSMNSARIISHLGTGKVTAFSTLLTAAALLGFSFSGSFWFMCLMAIPLGLGAGCVDSALNNYVSIHYNATVMSFLHCFYGVGVMVSPYIMSVVINSAVGWRGGYRTASLIQALIGSILLLA